MTIPTLISEMERQFKGTNMNASERELARLCWLGGAWALFRQLGLAKMGNYAKKALDQYTAELQAFVDEMKQKEEC